MSDRDTDTTDSDPTEDLVTDRTRAAEEDEAGVTGRADRPPTEKEERLAEESAVDVDESVARHYEEMGEIGANVKGEGEI
jgi:hypothetical protein